MAESSMENSEASSAFANRLLWAAIGALLLLGTLGVGLSTDFLPCTLDCGETYEAHVAARNLWRFGWAHGGLQDFAANPDPAAHPALYIHNPNLGMYALAGLFALGIRTIHTQTPWLLLPFFVGLAYLYLAIRAVTRSLGLAACCLLQAASLYLLVVLWQFDALRVWSWLLTWGLVYHLVRGGIRRRGLHLSLAALYLALGIGVDYPFALFLAVLAVALAALRLTSLGPVRAILLAGVAVGGAALLRQLQVAMVLGPAVWWTDLSMSIARRLPITTAWAAAVDPTSFAAAHGLVIWPGGGGPPQPLTWAWVMIRAQMATVGWPLLVIGALWLWAVAHRSRLPDGPLRRGLELSLALAAALTVTFLVFGEYLASFYGIYLMPLVVHWTVVALGLLMWLLWTHRWATWRLGRVVVPVGLTLLVAFGLWRGGTEVRHVLTLQPVAYPGHEILREYPGASVATLWISSAPSAYTDQWAASLRTMRWLVQGLRGFTFAVDPDYYTFFERDRENPAYRRPDLLLVPRLRTWGLTRRCTPLGGAVLGFADGCSDLSQVETALARLPLARRGPDYLLYDLRVIRATPESRYLTGGPIMAHREGHEQPPIGGPRWQMQ